MKNQQIVMAMTIKKIKHINEISRGDLIKVVKESTNQVKILFIVKDIFNEICEVEYLLDKLGGEANNCWNFGSLHGYYAVNLGKNVKLGKLLYKKYE